MKEEEDLVISEKQFGELNEILDFTIINSLFNQENTFSSYVPIYKSNKTFDSDEKMITSERKD